MKGLTIIVAVLIVYLSSSVSATVNCYSCSQSFADAKVLALLNVSFLMPSLQSWDCNDYPTNGSNINFDLYCPNTCFSVTNIDSKTKRTLTIRGCTDWSIKSTQWAVMAPFTPSYLPTKCYIGWIGSPYVSTSVSGNSYFCFCNTTNCNSVTAKDAAVVIQKFLAAKTTSITKTSTLPAIITSFLFFTFIMLNIYK